MGFVDKVKKEGAEYDIRDGRLPETGVEDAGKALVVGDDGAYGLGEVGAGGIEYIEVELSPNPDLGDLWDALGEYVQDSSFSGYVDVRFEAVGNPYRFVGYAILKSLGNNKYDGELDRGAIGVVDVETGVDTYKVSDGMFCKVLESESATTSLYKIMPKEFKDNDADVLSTQIKPQTLLKATPLYVHSIEVNASSSEQPIKKLTIVSNDKRPLGTTRTQESDLPAINTMAKGLINSICLGQNRVQIYDTGYLRYVDIMCGYIEKEQESLVYCERDEFSYAKRVMVIPIGADGLGTTTECTFSRFKDTVTLYKTMES